MERCPRPQVGREDCVRDVRTVPHQGTVRRSHGRPSKICFFGFWVTKGLEASDGSVRPTNALDIRLIVNLS